MGNMAEFRVYRSNRSKSHDDSEIFDWELSIRWEDGAVTRPNYSQRSWYQLERICFEMLRRHPEIEQIFVWRGNSWWGTVSRSQEM